MEEEEEEEAAWVCRRERRVDRESKALRTLCSCASVSRKARICGWVVWVGGVGGWVGLWGGWGFGLTPSSRASSKALVCWGVVVILSSWWWCAVVLLRFSGIVLPVWFVRVGVDERPAVSTVSMIAEGLLAVCVLA